MAQIQKGTTYTDSNPGNKVTHTNLNAHVDNASLLPGAITDQTTLATTASDDYALVSDTSASAALKKVTLANLIPDSGIATAKLADDAVTNAKLADDAVDSAQIADGAIDAVHLASDSVTTAKILDENVTAEKLAATLDLSGKTVTLPGTYMGTGETDTAGSTLSSGTQAFAHSLGAVPRVVRAVLVCQTGGDSSGGVSWNAGDELAVEGCLFSNGLPAFMVWADASAVYVRQCSSTIYVLAGGSATALTSAKWKVKTYQWT